MKRTPIKRTKPLKAKAPVKQESAKQKTKNRAYRKHVDLKSTVCGFCGAPPVHRHHIYLQSDKSFLAQEPLNILPVCQECHDECHQNIQKSQKLLRKLMPERMKQLDKMANEQGKVNRNRRLGT